MALPGHGDLISDSGPDWARIRFWCLNHQNPPELEAIGYARRERERATTPVTMLVTVGRGLSRVHALQAGGHRFDPGTLHRKAPALGGFSVVACARHRRGWSGLERNRRKMRLRAGRPPVPSRYGTSRSRRPTRIAPTMRAAVAASTSTRAPAPRMPCCRGDEPIHQNAEKTRNGSSHPASECRPETR